MDKGNDIYLGHVLESIKAIKKYTRGVTKSSFSSSEEKQDSVIRRLEIIGEAVRKLDKDLKKKYDKIEWAEIAGMRDILIHDYFGVDVNLVWNTVKKDIPKLEKYIKEIYNE